MKTTLPLLHGRKSYWSFGITVIIPNSSFYRFAVLPPYRRDSPRKPGNHIISRNNIFDRIAI